MSIRSARGDRFHPATWLLGVLASCGSLEEVARDLGGAGSPDAGTDDLPPLPESDGEDTEEELDEAEREDDALPQLPIEQDELPAIEEGAEPEPAPGDGGTDGGDGSRREAGRRAFHDLEPLGPFTGRVGYVSIYVSEPGRMWSNADRRRTRRKLRVAMRRIRRYATGTGDGRPGVTLRFPAEGRRLNVTLANSLGDNPSVAVITGAVNTGILAAYPHDRNRNGFSTDELVDAVRRRYRLDHVVLYVHLNRAGRSFAYRPSGDGHATLAAGRRTFVYRHAPDGPDYARVGTYMHETMHLFGASDEYREGTSTTRCACSESSRGAINGNCANCPNVRQVPCIMHGCSACVRGKYNEPLVACPHTRRAVGWDCPGCGNGVCEASVCEDPTRCPQDCPINRCCADTNGNPGETAGRCPRNGRCCCSGGAVCKPTGGGWVCSR